MRALLKAPFAHPLLLTLGAAAVVVTGLNLYARRELPADPRERADRLAAAGLKAEARTAYEQLLAGAPLDLELQRAYLATEPPLRETLARYEALAKDPAKADVARYCMGYAIVVVTHDYAKALEHFRQVRDPELRYLNNSIGKALLELKRPAEAEPYFRKEIALGLNLEGAVSNLGAMYREAGDVAKMRALIADPVTGSKLEPGHRLWLALRTGDVVTLLPLLYAVQLRAVSPVAAAEALMLCLMWFVYLRRVDVFEREPLPLALGALLLGMLATPLVFPLHELWSLVDPRKDSLQDPVFAILHVGLIEEIVKLLPVLLLAALSKELDEPVDYVIYGSLSALGFATLENAQYFTRYGQRAADLVFVRFVFCILLHVFCTSIVCYLWARARFVRHVRPWPWVLGGVAVAATWHGLYDHWAGDNEGLLLLVVLGTGLLYGRMLGNCLAFSPYYDPAVSASPRLVNYELIESAAALTLLVPFLDHHFTLSTTVATERLASTASFRNLLLVAAVFLTMGEIGVSRGREVWFRALGAGVGDAPASRLDRAMAWARGMLAFWGVVFVLVPALVDVRGLWDAPLWQVAIALLAGVVVTSALWVPGIALLLLAALPARPRLLEAPPASVPPDLKRAGDRLIALGFAPALLPRRVMRRFLPARWLLVYVNAAERSYAVASKGLGPISIVFRSSLAAGAELLTSADRSFGRLPGPRSLVQVFPRLAPGGLFERHRQALAHLQACGLQVEVARAQAFLDAFEASSRGRREAFLAAPIRATLQWLLRLLPGTGAHRGALASQPLAAERLERLLAGD